MATFYKHISVSDIPSEYVKYIVGKNGGNLKKCCHVTGVQSVWYNPKRHILQIYGPVDKLEHACVFMEKHLDFVRSIITVPPLEELPKKKTNEPDVCVVAHLDGVMFKQDVKYLIGKRGTFFKQFTKLADVSFIWYDEQTHTVTIWGPKENLSTAIQMLFDHMNVLNENLNECFITKKN